MGGRLEIDDLHVTFGQAVILQGVTLLVMDKPGGYVAYELGGFYLGDAIAVMRDGRFEQFGPPEDIVRAPATPFVADLVGETGRALRLLALKPVGTLLRAGQAQGDPVDAAASLSDALAEMIWTGRDRLPVVDGRGQGLGIVTRDDILAAGRRIPSA